MANHFQEPLTTFPKPVLTEKHEQLDEEIISWQALTIANTLAFPMVFKAILELGVFDAIAAAGKGAWLSSSDIALSLPTKPTNPEAPVLLDRMLRFLVSHSILKCRVVETAENSQTGKNQLVYAAEPVCKFFLKSDGGSGSYMYLYLFLQSEFFFKTWTHLKDIVMQEGKDAFSRAHGMRFFEYLGSDQQYTGRFNQAVAESSVMVMNKILKVYKGFEDINTLVDIGGGPGTVLSLVTSKYPHIKGINFDIDPVIATAPNYPGVEHVSGDMFIEVPKGDAIFMKWILHDWSDEDCVKIFKNCWKSLPEKGKVIIAELIIQDEPKSKDTFSQTVFGLDMLMLSQFSGGRDRSFSEYEALASASGFLKCEIICVAYAFSVIEFHK